jgi:hypothetical protein
MVCRENDGMRFHELKCLDCGAQFSFGQKRQGGDLFPRRRDSQGNYLPDHGWYKFEKTKPVNPKSQKSQKCDRVFSEVVWTSKP